jgi:hypothetical protein
MADLKRFMLYDPVTGADASITAGGDLTITLDGETVTLNRANDYFIANTDISSDPKYYGFEHADGNYYIMKETGGAYTYTAGSSGYATAWTNRASETYALPSVTF